MHMPQRRTSNVDGAGLRTDDHHQAQSQDHGRYPQPILPLDSRTPCATTASVRPPAYPTSTDRGYARSCMRTSENTYRTRFAESHKAEVRLRRISLRGTSVNESEKAAWLQQLR